MHKSNDSYIILHKKLNDFKIILGNNNKRIINLNDNILLDEIKFIMELIFDILYTIGIEKVIIKDKNLHAQYLKKSIKRINEIKHMLSPGLHKQNICGSDLLSIKTHLYCIYRWITKYCILNKTINEELPPYEHLNTIQSPILHM